MRLVGLRSGVLGVACAVGEHMTSRHTCSTSFFAQIPTLLGLVLAWFCNVHVAGADPPKPNLIHIYSDDLGFGCVGYNGQVVIQTPNLDALAAQGMRFDNGYTPSVCAPSRAQLLTGFHAGHTFTDRNRNSWLGFRLQDITVAEVLSQAGYTTGIFGKWGFGGSKGDSGPLRSNPFVISLDTLPPNQGFGEFLGYLNHSRATSYFVDSLWQDDANAFYGVSPSPTGNTEETPYAFYSHDLLAARSEQFIEDHAGDAEPFYMQLSYQIVHADIDGIAELPHGLGIYADDPDLTDKEKKYAAMITRMDTSIGSLLTTLEDPDGDGDSSDSILENTLILFTSDNGPTKQDGAPYDSLDTNGPFRGGKGDLYDGGTHVPLLAWWPGTIPPGSVSDLVTDHADFLPTVAELAGVRAPVGADGVSIAPTLTGGGIQRKRAYLIFENHGPSGRDPGGIPALWAIIREGIKLIEFDDGSLELYDLNTDPAEQVPLDPDAPKNIELVAELEAIALAEEVEADDSFAVAYRQWVGGDGADIFAEGNWQVAGDPDEPSGSPDSNWSATLVNTTGSAATVHVTSDLSTLGFEVRGDTADQTVVVDAGARLSGRNEVRISENGVIRLDDGSLDTVRWVDVLAEGELAGIGDITGDVYNAGRIAPGTSPGGISIDGDYVQLADGTFDIEVAGHPDGQLVIEGSANISGALMITLFAPPAKWLPAFSIVVNTPEDSTTTSTSSAPHGIVEGSLQLCTLMTFPLITKLPSFATRSPSNLPWTLSNLNWYTM